MLCCKVVHPRFAVIALVALSGCSPRSSAPEGEQAAIRYLMPDDYVEIMEGADRMVLEALDPTATGAESSCGERLSEPIIGNIEERDREEIRRAARDVYSAILDASGGPMCFEPELSLRFERGDRSIELVICEECNLAWMLVDDVEYRPSVSIARLRRSFWPRAAADLRRRCGVEPLPMDLVHRPRDAQYHDGILSAGICCEPRM